METLPTLEQALAGRYALIKEIGRGGMAVVYLADDVRHQRRVALKALHPELATVVGPERFLSEIRITARLQHPNLLPLFDSGDAGGVPYYVMPYVEGESLRSKLERERQLPVSEAVTLATKIASALDHAHRAGIVHRDLKPENILLRDGEPLIADFGIGLAVSNAAGNRLTQTGLSVGTPQYMSPEQAAAERTIDGRTDIYSLGAMLYEMLTGEPPHTGPTAHAVLAKVVAEPVRSTRITRPAVPPHVDAAVLKALEKVPADRWASAREMASALATAGDARTALNAGSASSIRTPMIAAAAFIVGVGATYLFTRSHGEVATVPYRFLLTLPESAAVSLGQGGTGTDLAISADGRTVVYVAGPTLGSEVVRGLWRRNMDELNPQPVPGARGNAPRISPNGSSLLFSDGGRLMHAALAGGAVTEVAASASSHDWIDSRSVVFARGSTFLLSQRTSAVDLWVATIGDTTARRLTSIDRSRGILGAAFPNVLPGGKRALVTIWKGQQGRASTELAVVSLDDGHITPLGIAGTNPKYSLGHILFAKDDGTLNAVAFDPEGTAVTGAPWQVAPQVLIKLSGSADFDVSDNGTLVYIAGSDFHRRLVAVDRNGVARPLFPELRRFFTPRVSPDGKRIAVEVGVPGGGFDVWSYDVASRTFGAVTTDGRSARPTAWSADGSKVSVLRFDPAAGNFLAYSQAMDGSGRSERLAPWSTSVIDIAWTGSTYLARTGDGQVEAPGDPPTTPRVIVPGPDVGVMRLSGDGQLIAYEARSTSPVEIVVRSLKDPTQIQVSSGGGREPVWSRDGSQVFYRGTAFLMAATIARNPLRVVRRDTLFRDGFLRGSLATNYDVLPNGQFVMIQAENPDVNPTVVVNWLRTAKSR